MAVWKFYGAGVQPVEAENIGQAIELLRARLGRYRIGRAITLKSRRHYYHIPPHRNIEVKNCRPGVWSS
jgi:hypothetical protein